MPHKLEHYPKTIYDRPLLNSLFTQLEGLPISIPPLHRSDFGGTVRLYAVCAASGGKIYVGTGFQPTLKKDWWEYDISGDSWTQLTDFGGIAREDAVCAASLGKIYVGTGRGATYKKDWWEYDISGDSWTQLTDFGGIARRGAVCASSGGKVFVGTGYNVDYKKDWWWQR
jgi:N-acetylneuraminic acid mutarotase